MDSDVDSREDSSSCCKKCHEIYNALNDHVLKDHQSTANGDSILNNVLLNILSLMLNKKSQQPSVELSSSGLFQSAISKPSKTEKKQTFFNELPLVDTAMLATVPNTFLSSSSQMDEPMTNTVPRDLQNKFSTMEPEAENAVETAKSTLPSVEVPFLFNPNDFNPSTALITPDGTLTTAGLAILFANQNKQNNVTGKSDLDVADILINKMPIPSLNRNIDPCLVSALYFHQLALNQQQPPTDGGNSDTYYNLQPVQSSNETSLNHSEVQNDTLQQLVLRYKQISGLIETMNNKQSIKHFENHLENVSLSSNAKSLPVTVIPTASRFPGVVLNARQQNLLQKEADDREIVLDQVPFEVMMNLLRGQNSKFTSERDNKCSVPSKEDLFSLQNLIIETVKEVDDGDDSSEKSNDAFDNPSDESLTKENSSTTDNPQNSKNDFGATKPLHKCHVCGITFSVLSTLQSHAKTHITALVETCTFCYLTFSDIDEYHRHVVTHRGEENVFVCPSCKKVLTSKGEYTKHIATHTQRRPYVCTHCQKAFRDPGSLTKHERIHTGEQPYVCKICDRGFAEKSSLRKHSRTHSGEKPYKCDQCLKSFSISGNLQRHMYIHSGQRPYRCTLCSKTFNNPSHLKRHIKNIHQK